MVQEQQDPEVCGSVLFFLPLEEDRRAKSLPGGLNAARSARFWWSAVLYSAGARAALLAEFAAVV
jgi:hypothetical protein